MLCSFRRGPYPNNICAVSIAPPSILMKSFVQEATTFCRLIEVHRTLSRKKFLKRISVVLPRVYAWACELPKTRSKGKYEVRRLAHKEWNASFKSLMRKLGPYD